LLSIASSSQVLCLRKGAGKDDIFYETSPSYHLNNVRECSHLPGIPFFASPVPLSSGNFKARQQVPMGVEQPTSTCDQAPPPEYQQPGAPQAVPVVQGIPVGQPVMQGAIPVQVVQQPGPPPNVQYVPQGELK